MPARPWSWILVVAVLLCPVTCMPVLAQSSLPSGWSDADVGTVGIAGAAAYASGVFTVQGAGSVLSVTADGFHFVYQPLAGDGTIVARVVSTSYVYAQAGVMIRETLDAGANQMFIADYAGSIYDIYRTATGAASGYGSAGAGAAPYWVKLIRSGSTFTGYSSPDGVNWVQAATQTITMAQNVYVGLAVASGNTSSSYAANFDSVSVAAGGGTTFPIITGLSPNVGGIGSSVAVGGSNFGSTGGVTFNGVAASVTSWSATTIAVSVPPGATSGKVVVVTAGLASNGINFTVVPVPSIGSVSPGGGPAGTNVALTGTNFGDVQGSSTVTFDGTTVAPTNWSATSIALTIPSGATTGNFIVTVASLPSNALNFIVAPAPTISGLSKSSGKSGTSVEIDGMNFGSTQGSGTVSLSGAPATATSWSDTAIVVTVPDGVPSGPFSVTVNTQTAISSNFTVTPRASNLPLPSGWQDAKIAPPTVYAVYEVAPADIPTGGSAVVTNGGQVTWKSATFANGIFSVAGYGQISGTADEGHFVYQPLIGDGTIVARVLSVSDSGAQAGVMIRETLNGGASQATTYGRSPYVYLFDRPSMGANGSSLANSYSADVPYWIELARTGNNFSAYTSSDGVNWTPCGSSQTIGMTENTFVGLFGTSGGESGMATVTFDNVSVNSVASPAPVITSLSATTGSLDSEIVISGSGFGAFQSNSLVLLNDTPITVNSWSGTGIVVTIPSGAASGLMVVSVAPSMNDSNPVFFSVTTQPLPTSWLDQDVGSVPTTGSATYTSGAFTVNGTGSGISSTADGMHFVYQPLSGDGTIVARVVSVTNGAETGIAIRETLNAGATEGVAEYESPYVYFYGRASTGASVANEGDAYAGALPYWLKLTRSENTVSCWSSSDGVNWTPVGLSQTITMAQNVDVGLFVANGGGSTLATATFDGVSITVTGAGSFPPSITSVSPVSGPAGQAVLVSGVNFGPSQGSSTITFNGSPATVTGSNWNATSIATTVPSSATTGNVVVNVGGTASNGVGFTVAPLPSLVSVAVSPAASTITVGSTPKFSALGTFSDGTVHDVSAVATWGSSNTSVLTISNLALVQGAGLAVSPGTATVSATASGFSGNGSATVIPVPSAPVITEVSPTSGAAGQSVVITGTGFGVQGSGQVYLGTALGIVRNGSNWSDTQITASIATGSTSGTVQVVRGGQQSNSVAFTINTPTITTVNQIGPLVQITGTGFGSAQGSGVVWIGSMPGIVQSWTDNQVSANVASGSISGHIQVLQNGIWSNSVPFSVGLPHITGITPTSGLAGSTQVIISGTGFGTNQGSGQVLIGGASGAIGTGGWSDTLVTATVASNALSGTVRIQQNSNWSNAESFTIIGTNGSSPLTITPTVLTLLAGATHTIRAINTHGQAVSGLTWVSNDTTVATLSTDDPPIITAIAAGHTTITAGNASSDVTVYTGSSLSPGTVVWSNFGDGSGVVKVVPAVPSPTGVADVFAFQSSANVSAITTDGATAWTASIGGSQAIPDFQGGLVVFGSSATQTTIQKLDGVTGQAYPAYIANTAAGIPALVHIDGTIFVADTGSIVGIDPMTGTAKFSVSLPQSESINSGNCGDFAPYDVLSSTEPGQGIIAGDGYAYFTYQYGVGNVQKACHSDGSENGSTSEESHSRLLRVGTDGSSTIITVGDSTTQTSFTCTPVDPPPNGGGECPGIISSASSSSNSGVTVGTTFTNADQGVVMSSYDCSPDSCGGQLSVFSGGSLTSTVATQLPLDPILQVDDGSFVGMSGNNMVAFDVSGNVRWSVSNYEPVMAMNNGGVVAQSLDGATISTFDSYGNANGQLASLPIFSWKGAYQVGSVDSIVPTLDLSTIAATYAALVNGNPTGNGTPTVLHSVRLFWCSSELSGSCASPPVSEPDLGFTYAPSVFSPTFNTTSLVDFTALYPNLRSLVMQRAFDAFRAAYAQYPVNIGSGLVPFQGAMTQTAEHTAYINADLPVLAQYPTPCGETSPNSSALSRIYYVPIMGYAQTALGNLVGTSWQPLSPTFPPSTDQLQNFTSIVSAIGIQIGNTSAHEIGHQFLLPDLDCGTSGKPCPVGPIPSYFYEYYSCSGYPPSQSASGAQGGYLNIGSPMQWTSDDSKVLTNKLLKK
jgi:regulation of enolase protein 1 (concanavalin A-like superfamily)